MATQLIKATDDGFVRTVQLLKSVRDTLKSNQGDLASVSLENYTKEHSNGKYEYLEKNGSFNI